MATGFKTWLPSRKINLKKCYQTKNVAKSLIFKKWRYYYFLNGNIAIE
jgi:hypothetical protein